MSLSTGGQAADVDSRTSTPMEGDIPSNGDPSAYPNSYVNLGLAENSMIHSHLTKHVSKNIAVADPSRIWGKKDGPQEVEAGSSRNPDEAPQAGPTR